MSDERSDPPSRDLAERGPASTTHLPHKPTRDSATAASHPDEAASDETGASTGAPAWAGEERQRVGGREENGRHPPHATENDDVPGEPALPANASGADRVPVGEQDQPIEEESMYDGRPSQDKDRPPSEEGR